MRDSIFGMGTNKMVTGFTIHVLFSTKSLFIIAVSMIESFQKFCFPLRSVIYFFYNILSSSRSFTASTIFSFFLIKHETLREVST
jgi:hypothetical protein